MPTDWQKLLSKDMGDVKEPATLPGGTYLFQVQSHRFDESSQKGTPFVEFSHKIIDMKDDVDRELLAEVGDLNKKLHREQFYLTDPAEFMLKNYLEALGLDTSGGRTFADAIPEATGRSVWGKVRQEPIPETDRFKAVVTSWAAVEVE
jgi:hypothetical protein